MITRENYEIYFIDYMDGNLSERERAEVEAFLLVHPDLQEQLDGMGEVRLEVPTEVFGKKEEIKQAVREREMEYYAIAVTEGVITDEERAWVDENTDKKVFEREVDVYAKIKVKPDPACRFEGKAGLYRKSGVILLVKRYAAIAAVVALGIVVAIYTTRKEEFSMEDIPMTVVKTETLPLPQVLEPEKAGEVGIIEEPERMMIQPTEQREAPVEVVERGGIGDVRRGFLERGAGRGAAQVEGVDRFITGRTSESDLDEHGRDERRGDRGEVGRDDSYG